VRGAGVSISFSYRVLVAPDVLDRAMGDETVLMNLSTQAYLGLDAVGTRVWSALRDSGSIEEAYQRLCGEYDVDPRRLRHDLVDFLGQLEREGLIEVVARTSTPNRGTK
jgi:hypothetical protein